MNVTATQAGSRTDTMGPVPVVAGSTVAEVAADRVDANCIRVAPAVVDNTFVNVWTHIEDSRAACENFIIA